MLALLLVCAQQILAQTATVSGSVNFGSVAVGVATPPTATVTFTFTGAGQIGWIPVLTQGALGQDFADTGNGTCATNGTSHNYGPGDSCTVVVSFTPKLPGLRAGVVELTDATDATIAVAHIYGIAIGPNIVVNTPINGYSAGGRIECPFGAAVDGSGNIFVQDAGYNGSGADNGLKKIYASNGQTEILAPYGGNAVSVDAAGNVFFGFTNFQTGVSVLKEFVANPGGTVNANSTVKTVATGFGEIYRLAVDAKGDVFVADGDPAKIWEVLAGTGGTALSGTIDINSTKIQVGPSGFFQTPMGVAVNAFGDVFVADEIGNSIYKIAAGTGGAAAGTVNDKSTVEAIYNTQDPMAVTVDAVGNVYVVAYYVNAVTEIFAGTGGAAPGTVVYKSTQQYMGSGALSYPYDVTADPSGNIFVSQFHVGNVLRFSQNGPSQMNFGTVLDGLTTSASNVMIENIGNGPLVFPIPISGTDPSLSTSYFKIDNSSTLSCPLLTPNDTVPGSLAVGAYCNLAVKFAPTSPAVGLITDYLVLPNNAMSIPLFGTAKVPVPTQLVFSTPPPANVAAGGNAGSAVTVTIEDALGNLSASATASVTLTVNAPNNRYQTYTVSAQGGVANFDLSGIALNLPGSYAYTATSSGLSQATATETVLSSSSTAPTEPAGTPSGAQTATLIFNSPTTLNSNLATAIQVLTMGAPNKDFAYAAGGTCTPGTTYSAGQACTVNYTFTPKYPGQRLGAIVLYDNSAPPVQVGIIHLSGMGTGPMVTFPSNTAAIPVGSGFGSPAGAVVDGNGNIFVTDIDTNSVMKIVAVNGLVSASSSVVTVASGFSNIQSLAVDGAGNLFVTDGVANTVSEVVAVSGGVSSSSTITTVGRGFNGPWGLAVDANGNVFVADSGNNAVKEIVAVDGIVSGSSTVKAVGSGFSQPFGLAVDANGNVFVADNGGKAVKEIVAVNGLVSSSSTVNLLGTSAQYYAPKSLVLDASGDVIVLDNGSGTVMEIVAGTGGAGAGTVNATSTVNVLIGGLGNSYGMTMDASGNLFIADSGDHKVNEFDLSDAPSLTFASTLSGATSSTQTVTVANSGNASLIFPLPTSGNNPSIANTSRSIAAVQRPVRC